MNPFVFYLNGAQYALYMMCMSHLKRTKYKARKRDNHDSIVYPL